MSSFDIPLLDTIDLEILMHCDVHFSGNFSLMLDYYEKGGIGVMEEFSLKKIKRLQKEQEKTKTPLSEQLLPPAAQEDVLQAKKMYLDLRDAYEDKKTPEIAKLISDLILSEEEHPEKEIKAICLLGKKAVPSLINLIKSDKLYNPLYPGYGRSPQLAAECLGTIHDTSAIAPLFEMLGQEDFFADDAIIKALTALGENAIQFLIKRLKHLPLSKENEHAAIALTAFPETELISKACLEMLQNPEVLKKISLATYLIVGCSALKNKKDQEVFIDLKAHLPSGLKKEIDLVAKNFRLTN